MLTISTWLYWIASIAMLLIGLLYAFMPRVMPYHLKALETTWEEIDPNYQRLLKALLNGGGYFGASTGLFMVILLLIPFRAGDSWAGYAIGSIGLVGSLPLGAIVYSIKKNTAGNPPLGVMIALNTMLIAGLVLFVIGQ